MMHSPPPFASCLKVYDISKRDPYQESQLELSWRRGREGNVPSVGVTEQWNSGTHDGNVCCCDVTPKFYEVYSTVYESSG
jgi:hypothetical protein